MVTCVIVYKLVLGNGRSNTDRSGHMTIGSLDIHS
jgi:hypothetical protein